MASNPIQTQDRLNTARYLLRQGKLTESELIYRELIAAGSKQAIAHYGLGVVQFLRGDMNAGEYEFRICLQDIPKHDDALYYLGLICEKRGESNQAPYYYNKALQANPGNIAAQGRLRALSLPEYTMPTSADQEPLLPSREGTPEIPSE